MCHFQSNFAGLEVLNPFFAKPKKNRTVPWSPGTLESPVGCKAESSFWGTYEVGR